MDRLFRFIAYRPGPVVALGAAIALVFAALLVDVAELKLRLRIQTEIEKILPADGPDRDLYIHFRELFGNYEMVFVGLTGADVFSDQGVQRIKRLTRRLEQLDGVRRVLSLSNAMSIRSEEGELRVGTAFDDVMESPADLEATRARILADPMLVGNLVSHDGQAAALLVYPEEMSEQQFRELGIDQEIERVAREVAGDDARVLMAGNPPLKATTGRILLRDVLLLVPLSFVFMGFIAFLSFRSLRGVVIPLVSIGAAQLLTLGTMVIVGRSLNLVTFIVPILINALAFAYSVHLVSDHDERLRSGKAGGDAAYEALKHVAFPVFLTAVTTAAGFLSLCMSRLPAIREFGAFCVVGVMGSLLVSLTLAPALIALMGRKPRPSVQSAYIGARIDSLATQVALFDLRHRGILMVAAVAVAIAALIGVSQIEVSTSFVSNLSPKNPLRVSSVAFDEELGGSTTFHVIIESDSPDTFKHPENLEVLGSLQAWLDEQPEVSKTNSLTEYLMVLNRAFHGGDSAYFKLPETKRAISQFMFFFWNDGLRDLVTPNYSAAHILVRAPSLNSHNINVFVDRVQAHLLELPESLEGSITGDTVLIGRTMDEIAWGQAVSLTGAVVIIYAILVVYFRSLRVAFLALIPNMLPVTVYFGILGLSGVTLNVITSLIACIVLGIAVDDTIHYLVRFRQKAVELGDANEAVVAALRSVARPVTSTTIALCAGFLILAASGLRHQVEFGVLSACMLVFAWLVDMTFTPALCARLGLADQAQNRPAKRAADEVQVEP